MRFKTVGKRRNIESHRNLYHNDPLFPTPTSVRLKQITFDWPGETFGVDSERKRVRRCYEIIVAIIATLIAENWSAINRILNEDWHGKFENTPVDIDRIAGALALTSHSSYYPGEVRLFLAEQKLTAECEDGSVVIIRGFKHGDGFQIVTALHRLLYARDNASYYLNNTWGLKQYTDHEMERCKCDVNKNYRCKPRADSSRDFAGKIFAREADKLKRIKTSDGRTLRDRNIESQWNQEEEERIYAGGRTDDEED